MKSAFVSEDNFLFPPRWPGSNATVESKITCKTLVSVVKQTQRITIKWLRETIRNDLSDCVAVV